MRLIYGDAWELRKDRGTIWQSPTIRVCMPLSGRTIPTEADQWLGFRAMSAPQPGSFWRRTK